MVKAPKVRVARAAKPLALKGSVPPPPPRLARPRYLLAILSRKRTLYTTRRLVV
jgi:hypothetical protein